MSHFTTIATEFRDLECLLKALGDLNITDVQQHETPQHLTGYHGDVRPEVAHIIVPREEINRKLSGTSSNDLGFLLKGGKYQAIVSEFDQRQWWNAKKGLLTQRYNYHKVLKEATRLHKVVRETKLPDGTIKLTMQA